MAKQIEKVLKLQIRGGAANPAPPVGPALGAAGVNIMEFCKQFNARTQDKPGKIVPVVITVFADKSFEFIIKTAPAASQLLEAAKKKKGSGEPNRQKVGTVSKVGPKPRKQPATPSAFIISRNPCIKLVFTTRCFTVVNIDIHTLKTNAVCA